MMNIRSIPDNRWLVVLAAVLIPALVRAQGVTTAGLRGTVTDAANESLPGANILAVHEPTGAQYGTSTSENGSFHIPNMKVGGPYRVRVTFVGYEPSVREGIRLALGQTNRLNITLHQSATELEEVVVTAGGLFDAERQGVATNISERELESVPTVGRSIADFARLTPQAVVLNGDDDGPAISIAGQNNRYNSIFIDGAVNNDVFGLSAQGTNGGQTGATPISMDAIEEFQIDLSPYDVTQSRFTGGAINAVTRSGTNQYQGSVYFMHRNEELAGLTPTEKPDVDRSKLPDFTDSRYGFPILRDELFFFVNGEMLRSETPQPFTQSYNGASAGEVDEIRQTVMDELGYDPGAFGDKASSLDSEKLLAKLDWNINQSPKLSARHSYNKADNVDAYRSDDDVINFNSRNEVFPSTTHSSPSRLFARG